MMLLEMAAQAFGDNVAFVNGEDVISYEQLYTAAGNAASALAAGDSQHLAMLDVSSLAFPVGLFAAGWSGRPFVPLNYRLAQNEVDALLHRVLPAALICADDIPEYVTGIANIELLPRSDFLLAARTGEAELLNNWSMEPEDVAVLLFTSGTTGAPKAAVLRHRHLTSYVFSSVEFASALGQTSLVTVPPYHIAGVMQVLSSVYAGRKVVQLPDFNAGTWIELARREQVTTAFLVPTMLGQVLDELEQQGAVDMPHLQAISYGGGKMPRPVIERAMKMFPDVAFTQAYGLTETSSTISVLLPDDHRAAFASDRAEDRARLASVGRALPGVEIQIRDDAGNVLGAGEQGEIFVRGEQVSGEYVGSGSLLDQAGWFATRDGGMLDSEGFLFLAGRADDVIVRGAENMSPGEIEDVILRHGAIADVAVVGVADEKWGEAVAAAVVLKPGADLSAAALQAWVREHLRSSRVPEHVQFVDSLPYNETGKLLRRLVKKAF